MNEKEKIIALLKAAFGDTTEVNIHEIGGISGVQNILDTHLSVDMINAFIKAEELEVREVNSEVCPNRALFNLIVGLNNKIKILEQELNFIKQFDINKPITEIPNGRS